MVQAGGKRKCIHHYFIGKHYPKDVSQSLNLSFMLCKTASKEELKRIGCFAKRRSINYKEGLSIDPYVVV